MPTSLQGWRQPLSYLAAAAILCGVLARFKSLGSAPFTVDEYYLARSIENVLRSGIPAFNCGGLYMRGLVLQYSAAVMQLVGLSPEFAPRFISALSSLLSIPAVFLLGRRTHGRVVGILAVTVVALSVWEIEMARFGRMYAPFQADFLWYLVFFLRYTVDRDARALWPMIVLSIAGPLIWEGGAFLPLANLLSLFLQRWPDRILRSDWVYLVCCTALLALAVWFVTADFRGENAHSWPLGYNPALSKAAPDPLTTLSLPLTALRQHLWWSGVAIAPLAATLFALRWVWDLRARWFAAAGLLAMLIVAGAHQFLAVAAIGLLLLLARLITWKELFSRSAAAFHIAIVLYAMFWLAFGIAVVNWSGGADVGSLQRRAAIFAYQLLRFPDFVGVVVRPWVRAVPILGAGLLLLLTAALIRMARSSENLTAERAMLVVFLVLLLAASASDPPRQETRYIFFLYPLVVVIALATIARAVALLGLPGAKASTVTAMAAVGAFALSEDFQPRHLLHIDSRTETFRLNMSQDMADHLVYRDDYPDTARWLTQHATANHATTINGVHALDYYYPGFRYFFVDVHDPNFSQWSCRGGSVERWGNYPLLYSVDQLKATIASSGRVYLVVFVYDSSQVMLELAALHPTIAYTQGATVILDFPRQT
jgi:Dolichyl-phosphate-mannose-protein mannosyltransferase